MQAKLFHIGVIFTILLTSCQKYNTTPRKVLSIDTVFTSAYSHAYGTYYEGLERNVFSLDLYSQGIHFQNDTLLGSGTHLCFTDIFLPTNQTVIQEGDYKVDSTSNCHTALGAMYFEGNLTGTHLILWNDAKMDRIYLFPTGAFSLIQDADTSIIEFHLQTHDYQTFDATFRGIIQYQ